MRLNYIQILFTHYLDCICVGWASWKQKEDKQFPLKPKAQYAANISQPIYWDIECPRTEGKNGPADAESTGCRVKIQYFKQS